MESFLPAFYIERAFSITFQHTFKKLCGVNEYKTFITFNKSLSWISLNFLQKLLQTNSTFFRAVSFMFATDTALKCLNLFMFFSPQFYFYFHSAIKLSALRHFIERFSNLTNFPITIKNSLICASLKAFGWKFILPFGLKNYDPSINAQSFGNTHLPLVIFILQVDVGSGLENHGIIHVNLFALRRSSFSDINRWISVHFR